MSWRVVATVIIAIFAILLLSVTTAGPLYEATSAIEDVDENAGEGGRFDSAEVADAGQRAYGNLMLILPFGLIAWGAWYLLRRELTEGRL